MAAPQLPRPTRFLHLGTEHTLCFREPWPLWSCGFFVLSCQTKQSHQLWVQNTQWCDFLKLFSYLSNQNSVSLCSGVGGEQCMLGSSSLSWQPAAWPTMLK